MEEFLLLTRSDWSGDTNLKEEMIVKIEDRLGEYGVKLSEEILPYTNVESLSPQDKRAHTIMAFARRHQEAQGSSQTGEVMDQAA